MADEEVRRDQVAETALAKLVLYGKLRVDGDTWTLEVGAKTASLTAAEAALIRSIHREQQAKR